MPCVCVLFRILWNLKTLSWYLCSRSLVNSQKSRCLYFSCSLYMKNPACDGEVPLCRAWDGDLVRGQVPWPSCLRDPEALSTLPNAESCELLIGLPLYDYIHQQTPFLTDPTPPPHTKPIFSFF